MNGPSARGPHPNKKERDPDLVNAEIALKRASKRAWEIAKQTDTAVVTFRDGRIVEEKPEGGFAQASNSNSGTFHGGKDLNLTVYTNRGTIEA